MRKVFLTVLMCIVSTLIIAGEEKKDQQFITLEEFVRAAVQTGRFQELLIDEIRAKYNEKLKIKPGDFVISAITEYQFGYTEAFTTESDRGADIETPAESTHNFKGSFSLSKLFSVSGTSLSGSYAINPRGSLDPTSTLSVQIEQEIIKNAFGRTYRIEKESAGNEREIAGYQVVEAYEEYLYTLIMLYFDWYSAYENVRFSRAGLKESQTLLENIKEKLKFRVAHPVDVYKAELQTADREEQLLKNLSAYNLILIRVKKILAAGNSSFDISPADTVLTGYDSINVNDTLEDFPIHSRTARLFYLANRNLELGLKISVNDLLPHARLYGGYILQGTGYAPETERSHTLKAGISLTYSIPQPGFLAEYGLKKTEKEKNELEYQNDLEDILVDIKVLYEKMETEKSLLTLAGRKIALSEAIVNDELLGYNQGRSTLNNLLSVYNTLDENRFAHKNHTIQLARYYIEWLRLTDRLVTAEKKVNLRPSSE